MGMKVFPDGRRGPDECDGCFLKAPPGTYNLWNPSTGGIARLYCDACINGPRGDCYWHLWLRDALRDAFETMLLPLRRLLSS